MLSKVLQNQEQMRLNIDKKLKTASSTQDLPVLKRKSVHRLAHFQKILKSLRPRVTVDMSLPTNNLKGALRCLKRL